MKVYGTGVFFVSETFWKKFSLFSKVIVFLRSGKKVASESNCLKFFSTVRLFWVQSTDRVEQSFLVSVASSKFVTKSLAMTKNNVLISCPFLKIFDSSRKLLSRICYHDDVFRIRGI